MGQGNVGGSKMSEEWRDALALVWSEKWEAIIGIVSIVLAIAAGLPLPFIVFSCLAGGLLMVDLALTIRRARRIVREKHIPVVVVVGKSDDEYRSMLSDAQQMASRWGYDEREFDAEFDVEREDTVVHRESRLPPDPSLWKELAGKFERKIHRIDGKLKGRRIYHLFLNCPAALALGMGSTLGTRYLAMLYHWVPPYRLVVNLYQKSPPGEVKRRIEPPYEFISVERPEALASEMFVSLSLSAHSIRGGIETLARQKGMPAVHIQNLYGGVLPLDADWLRVAQEVNSVLLELIARPEVNRLHLALAAPLPLAFLIGMALGRQSLITVHHWFADLGEYHPVLELEKL